MHSRLLIALALSLVFHGAVLAPDLWQRLAVAPARPALQASLRLPQPPPLVPPAPAPDEPLLKNTIDSEEAPLTAKPAPTPPERKARAAPKREVQSAQRKLSEHLFYPAEAVERGIEGEVRLLVKVTAEGKVDSVSLAATSGHAILDNAAIRAAYASGNLGGGEARQLIVPVIFRLQ